VLSVVLEASDASVVRGRSLDSGQRRLVVDVEPLGLGELSVVDDATGLAMEGLDVLEHLAISARVPQVIDFSAGLRFVEGVRSGDERRRLPEPPKWARVVCSPCSSPVPVRLSELDRVLWVGKPGYQWEQVAWASTDRDAVVRLAAVSALELAITHLSSAPGLYDALVLRDTSVVASWASLRTDRVLFLEEAAAGPYRVILRRRRGAGEDVLYDATHFLEPHALQRIELDVQSLSENLPAPGSLTVHVQGYGAALSLDRRIELLLAKVQDSQVGLSTFRKPLSALTGDSHGRTARFDDLPAGEYVVALSPCGIEARVTLDPEAHEEATFDLSELAMLRVWPVDDGDAGEAARGRDHLRLLWKPTSSTPPAGGERGARSAEASAWGEREWLVLRPATREGESWSILCLPGQVALLAVDGAGRARSSVTRVDVGSGANEATLELQGVESTGLRVRVLGLARDRLTASPGPLESILRALGGADDTHFVTRLDAGSSEEAVFLVHLSSPGVHEVRQPELPGYEALSPTVRSVRVGAGETVDLLMEWRAVEERAGADPAGR